MPYLIDGNNLLGFWSRSRGDEAGRAEVVRRVAEFCRRQGAKAIIVFDGPPLRGDLRQQTLGAVSLRVAPPGQDADSVIRDLVSQATRAAELIVVTSDKALYSYVRARGAAVLRAPEWHALALRSQAPPRDGDEKPAREDDIDGWLRQFDPPAAPRTK